MLAQAMAVLLGAAQAAECFDRHQALDAVADRGGEAGDAGAHRMAEQAEAVPAQCVGDIEHVADRGGRGVAGTGRQMRAVAMAGQVDGHQLQRRQVRRQRHEAGGVVEPAMQGQHARAVAVVAQAGDAPPTSSSNGCRLMPARPRPAAPARVRAPVRR
jgi:hypothetical protein